MSSLPSSWFVRVRHCGRVVELEIPCTAPREVDEDVATIRDVKRAIWAELRIPVDRQRILIPGRTKVEDTLRLCDDPRLASTTRSLGSSIGGGGGDAAAAGQPLHAHMMVIGTADVSLSSSTTAAASSSAMSLHSGNAVRNAVSAGSTGSVELSSGNPARPSSPSLLLTSYDDGEGVYTCSYGHGYTTQDAFYCRSCANSGSCAAKHFICFACAEVCHANHEVENWGSHSFLRCDCCTMSVGPAPPSSSAKKVAKPFRLRAKVDSDDNDDSSHSSSDQESGDDGVLPRGGDGKRDDAVTRTATTRCRFVVDEATGLPPAQPLAPNALNRYPTRTETWCYCKGRGVDNAGSGSESTTATCTAGEVEEEDDGINCMLCHNVVYSSHVTRLNVSWLPLISCYAETQECNTVGFVCRTCNRDSAAEETDATATKIFCTACALHCHLLQGHEVDSTGVDVRWQDSPSDRRSLKCACAGLCQIAHRVPDSMLASLGSKTASSDERRSILRRLDISPALAKRILEDDEVCAFVCAECMQAYPWLWDVPNGLLGDLSQLRQCRRGQYQAERGRVGAGDAAASPSSRRPLPIVRCGAPPQTDSSKSAAPASDATSPVTTDPDVFPWHGMIVAEDLKRFLCSCDACQLALSDVAPRRVSDDGLRMFWPYGVRCDACDAAIDHEANGYLCTACELRAANDLSASSFFLCRACFEEGDGTAVLRHQASEGPDHNRFVADTFENLWGVLGASVVSRVNPETRQWMLEHWHDGYAKELILDVLHEEFGAKRVEGSTTTTVAAATLGDGAPPRASSTASSQPSGAGSRNAASSAHGGAATMNSTGARKRMRLDGVSDDEAEAGKNRDEEDADSQRDDAQ